MNEYNGIIIGSDELQPFYRANGNPGKTLIVMEGPKGKSSTYFIPKDGTLDAGLKLVGRVDSEPVAIVMGLKPELTDNISEMVFNLFI